MELRRNVLLISSMMFNLINGAVLVVFPLYLLSITANDYLIAALVTGLPLSAQVLGNYVWGRISDNLHTRKKPAIVGCFAGSLLFLLLPFASAVSFVVIRTFQSLLLSSQILLQNLVSDTTDNKGRELGTLNIFANIGVVAGTLSFLFLLPSDSLTFEYISLFSIALTLCGLIGTFFLCFSKDVKFESGNHVLGKHTKNKTILILFTVTAVLMWANYTVFSLFPVYISIFHVNIFNFDLTGVKLVALFIGSSSLFGIPGSYVAGYLTDRKNKKVIIAVSIVIYATIWILLSMVSDVAIIYIIWVLPVWLFFVLPATALASESVVLDERGRAIGLINAGIGLGALLGSYTAGTLVSHFSFSFAYICAGLIALLALIPLYKVDSPRMG